MSRQDNARAGLGKRLRGSQADARARARNQGNFAVKWGAHQRLLEFGDAFITVRSF